MIGEKKKTLHPWKREALDAFGLVDELDCFMFKLLLSGVEKCP
jgi:hypothetical protein